VNLNNLAKDEMLIIIVPYLMMSYSCFDFVVVTNKNLISNKTIEGIV